MLKMAQNALFSLILTTHAQIYCLLVNSPELIDPLVSFLKFLASPIQNFKYKSDGLNLGLNFKIIQ
jgi:hypothetical protein